VLVAEFRQELLPGGKRVMAQNEKELYNEKG
jgi:hypothetical protein